MKEPKRLLQMPDLARRLGVFYSVVYKAFTCGELSPDFQTLGGSPLFEEEKADAALMCLKGRLSAEDFEEAKIRLFSLLTAHSLAAADDQGQAFDAVVVRAPTGEVKRFAAAPVIEA